MVAPVHRRAAFEAWRARTAARWSRRRRALGLLVVALVLAVVGLVVADLVRISADLEAGRSELTELDLVEVGDEGLLDAVLAASDRLDDAHDRARSSPWLRAVRLLPVVDTQVDGLRDLTAVTADLGAGARAAAIRFDAALGGGGGGEGRLRLVDTASEVLRDLQADTEAATLPAPDGLLPPLTGARARLEQELRELSGELERGARLTEALSEMLRGPRRYLVLGGNNAEMRSVAIPTTSGIAEIADGSIAVGDFSPASCCDSQGIELSPPGVPVPEAYAEVFGWLRGERGYRTTLASANWPLTAQIMADITARNVYGPVDGIIYVDTFSLAALLDVLGPVTVDGIEYRSDTVLEQLLYENYVRFEDPDTTDARRDAQSRVARAVFDALESRDLDLTRLAGTLADLARSRHLQAWAADPAEDDLWRAFGANRPLGPDDVLVASQDLGASKLDWSIDLDVDVDVREVDDHRRVSLTIGIDHPDRGPSTAYVDGGSRYAEPGEYGSFLTVYLPADAYDIANEDPGLTTVGTDGPSDVVGTVLRVPEGERREVVVTFSVPSSRQVLHVLPAARARGSLWRLGDQVVQDLLPFDVDLREEALVADPALAVDPSAFPTPAGPDGG